MTLYGATSGRAFFSGRVGERFAVRNSGALAVVEGVGEHACEYMTGGCVVVIGPTGQNFGAGMSGGVAFVHNPDGKLAARTNHQLVDLDPVNPEREPALHELLTEHVRRTGSEVARELARPLGSDAIDEFTLVIPRGYKEAMARFAAEQAACRSRSGGGCLMADPKGFLKVAPRALPGARSRRARERLQGDLPDAARG